MRKFYSQAGQDEWIGSFFEWKKKGFFLDIGAHNGIDINNTYFLEKELDWNGICIEADPEIFGLLKQNRNSHCLNVGVSDVTGEMNFLPDGFSGRESNLPEAIKIKTKTIRDILDLYNTPKIIDYVSLDIEGMELKALKGFPFEKHQILAMTVEHNLYTGKFIYKEQIKDFLLSKGFIIYKENVEHQGSAFEDWFIHKMII